MLGWCKVGLRRSAVGGIWPGSEVLSKRLKMQYEIGFYLATVLGIFGWDGPPICNLNVSYRGERGV
jgi:hypothetical protein